MKLFMCETMLNYSLWHSMFVFAENAERARELFKAHYEACPYQSKPWSNPAKITDIKVREIDFEMVVGQNHTSSIEGLKKGANEYR